MKIKLMQWAVYDVEESSARPMFTPVECTAHQAVAIANATFGQSTVKWVIQEGTFEQELGR